MMTSKEVDCIQSLDSLIRRTPNAGQRSTLVMLGLCYETPEVWLDMQKKVHSTNAVGAYLIMCLAIGLLLISPMFPASPETASSPLASSYVLNTCSVASSMYVFCAVCVCVCVCVV